MHPDHLILQREDRYFHRRRPSVKYSLPGHVSIEHMVQFHLRTEQLLANQSRIDLTARSSSRGRQPRQRQLHLQPHPYFQGLGSFLRSVLEQV